MNRYLISLEARTPGDMDPEIRADLFARTREMLDDEYAQDFHRVVGKQAVVGIVEMELPHEFIAGLPLFPWLEVSVVALARR
ncbi:muconolactone Delta-isomerase family protein [Corynebacterium lubricantis]|uniref:muconolactone Delta-isomerase family protein n=1 Tax=Corynebacterium lubricantis TaxID=541095 RepID=UPI00146140DA|nr:muconolactone Delta-isomerase family protein [Corynebacterium lubricantis]